MKTFREYLEGKEVNESFLRKAALAGAAALGLAGGPAKASDSTLKQTNALVGKINQGIADNNDAHNEIKKLKDGAYDKLLMKTNLTDDEKVFMDWMESLIRRNTSVALEILKEKHYTDSNFNNKLDLNDPVVKFVFKIHPEFKKAMQEGGKNWMQSHAPGAAYDINMERERHPLRTGDSPGMRDILRRSINPR
jgi:hypothetical protein